MVRNQKGLDSIMLYKFPGKMIKIDGSQFDYCIVKEDEKEKSLKQGWSMKPIDAMKKYDLDKLKKDK